MSEKRIQRVFNTNMMEILLHGHHIWAVVGPPIPLGSALSALTMGSALWHSLSSGVTSGVPDAVPAPRG